MIDPEITQIKARLTLLESEWIECLRQVDRLMKKIDGFTELLERNPRLIE